MVVYCFMLFVLFSVAILVAYSKAPIVMKSILIPAIIFSSIVSFLMLQEYLGKPDLITHIPSEVTVYGQVIDKENDTIYMLFTKNDELPPATYSKMAYNERLAKALAMGRKGNKGKPFKMKATDGEGAEEPGDGKAKKTGKKKGGSLSLESASFSIHELPPLRLPEK